MEEGRREKDRDREICGKNEREREKEEWLNNGQQGILML